MKEKMPLYAVLAKFTNKRMENIENMPEELEQARDKMAALGVEVKSLVYTMGQYDIICIAEAPNDEAVVQMNLDYGREGLIRTETLKAFSPEDFVKIVKKIT
jgi:uncharacterized protein with GYD domain